MLKSLRELGPVLHFVEGTAIQRDPAPDRRDGVLPTFLGSVPAFGEFLRVCRRIALEHFVGRNEKLDRLAVMDEGVLFIRKRI
jgi:hypothetical protein